MIIYKSLIRIMDTERVFDNYLNQRIVLLNGKLRFCQSGSDMREGQPKDIHIFSNDRIFRGSDIYKNVDGVESLQVVRMDGDIEENKDLTTFKKVIASTNSGICKYATPYISLPDQAKIINRFNNLICDHEWIGVEYEKLDPNESEAHRYALSQADKVPESSMWGPVYGEAFDRKLKQITQFKPKSFNHKIILHEL